MTAPLTTAPVSREPAPAPVRATPPRFTVDGDAALERHLSATCDRIGAGLRGLLPAGRLEGVALGGGYGRGEGGVLREGGADRAYNDLEFYVFLRGSRHLNEQRYGRALHVLGEILTPQAGIDVEFRITSVRELAHGEVSMFSYDLVSGHRWLVGDDTLLRDCAHHRIAQSIPLGEATRLLMNRATGLLLARERLARAALTPADADFVARNVAKAQLGAGDAVLTAMGQYHWSARERHRRLQRLTWTDSWLADVRRQHSAGVAFKLHPTRSTQSAAELATLHGDVSAFCRDVWLWLESRRLGRSFRSVLEYAAARRKCPETSPWRNALVNARLAGPKALVRAGVFRHPRERVLTALPLLLWHPGTLEEPARLRQVQAELGTSGTTLRELVPAYRSLWERVN